MAGHVDADPDYHVNIDGEPSDLSDNDEWRHDVGGGCAQRRDWVIAHLLVLVLAWEVAEIGQK